MFKFPIDPLLQQHLNLSNSLGPELTTNGTFTGDASGWTLGAAWAYSANTASKNAAGVTTLSQALSIATSKVYLVVYTVAFTVTTGGVTVAVGGTSGTNRASDGTYREYIKTANATGALTFTPGDTAGRFTIDTVSVKEVGAAPADQVTVWVEDQGGTAGKATLYIRGENGTVVGIGGDGLTFGANDEDVTLAYTANTLTLAGGVLAVPSNDSQGSPAIYGAGSTTGIRFNTAGTAILFDVSGNQQGSFGSSTFTLAAGTVLGFGGGTTPLAQEAANILQQGDDGSVPAAQIFKGPDARAGTDSNTVGGAQRFAGGRPTGTGLPGLTGFQGSLLSTTAGTAASALIDRFIANAAKVLTNNSAVAVVNATIANGTSVGGKIVYTIEVWDGTDNQVEIGEVNYKARNKAGTVVATLAELNSAQEVDSGTLGTTWAISAANPAVISINANSSLTPSTGYPRITFSIQNLGQQAIAIQ